MQKTLISKIAKQAFVRALAQRFPVPWPTGFALVRQVTRHTFGLVQSKLFPVYFYCLLAANLSSLVVYALHHVRETGPDWHENVQVRGKTKKA